MCVNGKTFDLAGEDRATKGIQTPHFFQYRHHTQLSDPHPMDQPPLPHFPSRCSLSFPFTLHFRYYTYNIVRTYVVKSGLLREGGKGETQYSVCFRGEMRDQREEGEGASCTELDNKLELETVHCTILGRGWLNSDAERERVDCETGG